MVALTRAAARLHKQTATTSPTTPSKKRKRSAADTGTDKWNAKKRKQVNASEATGAEELESTAAASTSIDTWDSIASLGLLARLPGELRNIIYAFALEGSIKMPCKLDILLKFDKEQKINAAPPASLLTSRQIRIEAMGPLIATNFEPYVQPLQRYVERSAKEGVSVPRTELTIYFQDHFTDAIRDHAILLKSKPWNREPPRLSEVAGVLRQTVQEQRRKVDKDGTGPVMFTVSRQNRWLRLVCHSGRSQSWISKI